MYGKVHFATELGDSCATLRHGSPRGIFCLEIPDKLLGLEEQLTVNSVTRHTDRVWNRDAPASLGIYQPPAQSSTPVLLKMQK